MKGSPHENRIDRLVAEEGYCRDRFHLRLAAAYGLHRIRCGDLDIEDPLPPALFSDVDAGSDREKWLAMSAPLISAMPQRFMRWWAQGWLPASGMVPDAFRLIDAPHSTCESRFQVDVVEVSDHHRVSNKRVLQWSNMHHAYYDSGIYMTLTVITLSRHGSESRITYDHETFDALEFAEDDDFGRSSKTVNAWIAGMADAHQSAIEARIK